MKLLWILLVFARALDFVAGEGTPTTEPPPKYPACSKRILIGYDNSKAIGENAYDREKLFLKNNLFNLWTEFKTLSLLSYSGSVNPAGFGSLRSKYDVDSFLDMDYQYDSQPTLCRVFNYLAALTDLPEVVILFVNIFRKSQVDPDCNNYAKKVNKIKFLTFVVLNSESVHRDELLEVIPKAQFFKWDIAIHVSPNDWMWHFNKAFACDNKNEQTVYFPCESTKLIFGIDESNTISGQLFEKQQHFLTTEVFDKEWGLYTNLAFLTYSNETTISNFGELNTLDDIISYINGQKRTQNYLDFCRIIAKLRELDESITNANVILFLSKTTKVGVNNCVPQAKEFRTRLNSITIVLVSNLFDKSVIFDFFPQARILMWEATDYRPPGWFDLELYGCDQYYAALESYPCDKKLYVSYDFSKELTGDIYQASLNLHYFAITRSQIAYAQATDCVLSSIFAQKRIKYCQTHKSLSFQFLSSSLVSKDYLFAANRCSFEATNLAIHPSTSVLNDNNGSRLEPLLTISNKTALIPCGHFFCCDLNFKFCPTCGIKREINFIVSRLFIPQWSQFADLSIGRVADKESYVHSHFESFHDRQDIKNFVLGPDQSTEDPQICEVFQYIQKWDSAPKLFVIIFLSKFVAGIDDQCQAINEINSHYIQITFVPLTAMVNITILKKLIPDSNFIEWEIDEYEEPERWENNFWKAFGCENLSPLRPHSTQQPTPQISTPTPKLSTVIKHSTTQSSKMTTSKITTHSSKQYSDTIETTQQSETNSLTHFVATTQPNKPDPPKTSDALYLGIFIPLFVILICTIAVTIWWCKKKNRTNLLNVIAEKTGIATNHYEKKSDAWMIPPECLVVNYIDKIGSGSFGDVYLGKLIGNSPIKTIYNNVGFLRKFHNCDVAVKTLPMIQNDDTIRLEFQREIEFMKSLKFNEHIVCMLGFVDDCTNPLLVLELCANGDLLNFVRNNKQKFVQKFEEGQQLRTLVTFAYQISSGLEYLSGLGLIHRDVALRNVLLDKDMRCKISDFGLCRTSNNQIYTTRGGKLPVRWLALESLKTYMYTQKTDVWAFGVLLYEMFSLGNVPYFAMENGQILEFLEQGNRLEKPKYCSDDVYLLMCSCWLEDPESRPNFTEINQKLSRMLEQASLHYYVAFSIHDETEIFDELEGESDV